MLDDFIIQRTKVYHLRWGWGHGLAVDQMFGSLESIVYHVFKATVTGFGGKVDGKSQLVSQVVGIVDCQQL